MMKDSSAKLSKIKQNLKLPCQVEEHQAHTPNTASSIIKESK
jgi:hypothetical protein